MTGVHPTAIIARDVVLGADVAVGPYSVIGAGVEIGPRCWIGPHVVVQGPTRLGADNVIFQFASIGDAPQDKKFRGEPTRLEIGERNVFRECCTINRGTATGHGVTRIGSDCLFMAYAHVAHDCIIGDHCIFSNSTALAGHVELGDWVILSGYAGVHQFCKVGAHVFLANNAAVTRDVPPFIMVAGTPAVPKGINAEGLKRRGFSAGEIANIKQAYRILYRSKLKIAEASERLTALALEAPEVQPFVDFLPRITRSLVR